MNTLEWDHWWAWSHASPVEDREHEQYAVAVLMERVKKLQLGIGPWRAEVEGK